MEFEKMGTNYCIELCYIECAKCYCNFLHYVGEDHRCPEDDDRFSKQDIEQCGYMCINGRVLKWLPVTKCQQLNQKC